MISATKRGIAFLSTYPPRACGIATYTTDLMKAISSKFEESFRLIPIPIVDDHNSQYDCPLGKLDIADPLSFDSILRNILFDQDIKLICIEHEFGLFLGQETEFISFLSDLNKAQIAIVVTFHTVLPAPDRTPQEVECLPELLVRLPRSYAASSCISNCISLFPDNRYDTGIRKYPDGYLQNSS